MAVAQEPPGYDTWLRYYACIAAAPFLDPNCIVSGFIAGSTARAAVAVTDRMNLTMLPESRKHAMISDKRDMFTRIRRRGLLHGLMFWLYIPGHRRAQWDLENPTCTRDRMYKTVYFVVFATMVARMLTNVWSNICDAAKANFMSRKHAVKMMLRHEYLPGLATLFVGQPPVMSAVFYHGGTLLMFESVRRFLRGHEAFEDDVRRRTQPLPIVATAVFNGVVAAGCATAMSSLTWYMHRAWYAEELSRPSALEQPLRWVLRREAVMVGLTYGVFTLVQPFVSPHHSRCGFGY